MFVEESNTYNQLVSKGGNKLFCKLLKLYLLFLTKDVSMQNHMQKPNFSLFLPCQKGTPPCALIEGSQAYSSSSWLRPFGAPSGLLFPVACSYRSHIADS